MGVSITIHNEIELTTSEWGPGRVRIAIPEVSSFWDLDAAQKDIVLNKAKDLVPYFVVSNDVEWAVNNYEGNDGFLYCVFEKHISKETLEKIDENPFLNDRMVKEIRDLYSLYLASLLRESLRRAPARTLKDKIIERDQSHCRYCGTLLSNKEIYIDHIIPYVIGGKTELNNLVVACFKCNSKKAGRTPEEARLTLLEIPA